MSESVHGHNAAQVTHIEADEAGQPCFGCYFGSVLDSLRDEQLTTIVLDPEDEDEDPELVDFARRIGAAMAYIADGLAAIAVQAAGPDADDLLDVFRERLEQMVVLHLTPRAPHGH